MQLLISASNHGYVKKYIYCTVKLYIYTQNTMILFYWFLEVFFLTFVFMLIQKDCKCYKNIVSKEYIWYNVDILTRQCDLL